MLALSALAGKLISVPFCVILHPAGLAWLNVASISLQVVGRLASAARVELCPRQISAGDAVAVGVTGGVTTTTALVE